MPEPSPTLPHLRREIAKHRSKAALVPGLPGLLTLIESHFVETDARIARLETCNAPAIANLEAVRSAIADALGPQEARSDG